VKKLIISEEQYKRLFLFEQHTQKDPYGWIEFGAPNSKTGLDSIPEDEMKRLKEKYENEKKEYNSAYDDAYSELSTMDPSGAGGQGVILGDRYAAKTTQKIKQEWEDNDIKNQYNTAKAWNWLVSINTQKYLISKYCKPVEHTGCEYICSSTASGLEKKEEAMKWRKYYKDNGGCNYGRCGMWYYDGDQICGNKKIKSKQYCITKNLSVVYDMRQERCPGCFNTESGGLFVYPVGIPGISVWNPWTDGVWDEEKYSYHCGCISNISNAKVGCSRDMSNLTLLGDMDYNEITGLNKKYREAEAIGQPGFFEGLGNWVSRCVDDYHCLLDVASIVVLVVPGIGPLLSMGLDIANGVAYGVEGYMSNDKITKYGGYTAGLLTIVGGVFTGYGLAKSLIKIGKASPKVMKFTDDVLLEISKKYGKKGIKKADDVIKKEIDDIFREKMLEHGLTESEVKYAISLIDDIKKLSTNYKVIKTYVDGLLTLEKKFDKVKFKQVFSKKKYQELLKDSKGNVLIALEKYLKVPEGRDVLIQLGMFGALETVLPEIIGNYVRDQSLSGNWGPRKMVESLGYNWIITKEIFGAVMKKNPDGSKNNHYTSKKSEEDNKLLMKAIIANWRPYKLPGKDDPLLDPMNPPKAIPVPEEYQTEKYKQNVNPMSGQNPEKMEKKLDTEKMGLLTPEAAKEYKKEKKDYVAVSAEDMENLALHIERYYKKE
jgi:hypothetical protein